MDGSLSNKGTFQTIPMGIIIMPPLKTYKHYPRSNKRFDVVIEVVELKYYTVNTQHGMVCSYQEEFINT